MYGFSAQLKLSHFPSVWTIRDIKDWISHLPISSQQLLYTHGFAECVGDQVVFMVLNLVQLLGLISTFEPFLVLPALPE
jgi:hypothetical protein